MAEKPLKMIIFLSPAAQTTLDRIWDWNSEQYGPEHGDRYVDFICDETSKLADEFFFGKPVPSRSNLNYITIRRSRRGHGHVAVYELIGGAIRVLDFFHTAQDWQAKLAEKGT